MVSRSNSIGAKATKKLKAEINDIADHFVRRRLISNERRSDGTFAYSLMHDYLVDSVELATATASSQTEKANQLLLYYCGERKTIPLKKLVFIRRFADRSRLHDPRARQVLRRSVIAPFLSAGAIAFAALILAGGVYLCATATIVWRAEVVAMHSTRAPRLSIDVVGVEGIGSVVTGMPIRDRHLGRVDEVRLWEANTAHVLDSFEPSSQFDPPTLRGRYLDIYDRTRDMTRIVDLATTSSRTFSGYICAMSSAGRFLCTRSLSAEKSIGNATIPVVVRSTYGSEPDYTVKVVAPTQQVAVIIADAGDRLVTIHTADTEQATHLYNVPLNKEVAPLARPGRGELKMLSVNDPSRLIYTQWRSPGEYFFRIYSLDDGHIVCDRFFGPKKTVNSEYQQVVKSFLAETGAEERTFMAHSAQMALTS